MKKCLTLVVMMLSLLTSFASFPGPDWDKPLTSNVKPVRVFTDPYVTNYGAYIRGTFNSPNYAVNIQVTFNQTVGVPYYAVVQVLGLWGGSQSASYREFTILFTASQHYKSVFFPMYPYEEAYTTVIDLLDYGPQ